MISQAYVSIKRIDEFCQEDEVPDWVSSLKRSPIGDGSIQDTRIAFENAEFRWNTGLKKTDPAPAVVGEVDPDASDPVVANTEDALPFELSDLNIEFPIGKITMVVGNVGSGKSALLNALLGEMECVRGRVLMPKQTDRIDPKTGLRNSIAFCSQVPWLQHKTIRENILFGELFDEDRYQMTLEACALIPDLEVLEDGDETEVGVRVSSVRIS
jgi:ABC-type multidrug transport system fused ATPase/permease subunit